LYATAAKIDFTEKDLRFALNNWRIDVLAWLGRESIGAGEALRAAEDGLAIAHRNPGKVAADVIEILWTDLSEAAVELDRLDQIILRIEEMDLATLLVLFQRTNRLQTYPWEGAAWQLPTSF